MNCIIASTSTIHGSKYLEYLLPTLSAHFKTVKEILFIPYARPSGITHDEYTKIAQQGFNPINKKLIGIHTLKDPIEAIKNAKGIFVGGGNTFLLVKTLYDNNLMEILQSSVLSGITYLGTSAGSNICGLNMQTTNDMPIVMPRSFETLGILPFNINAHYMEPDPKSTHKGETRRTRIKEFQVFNNTNVIGLKEGSWIEVKANTFVLKGGLDAVWFQPNKVPKLITSESNLTTFND